ncbi:MAG TPA: hypothetical protein VFZ25_16740 [Chloroflexota bacterium]|nr:hypothetical protein [Chloroflexota bacterium]
MELRVAGLAFAAVFSLAWFRPSLVFYGLGSLSLLFGFLGIWLSSPAGAYWVQVNLFHDPGFGLYSAAQLALLAYFFPIAWILLTASVSNLKVGTGSYLLLALVALAFLSHVDWFNVDSVGIFLHGLHSDTIVSAIVSWPMYFLR